jgi:hypothetical protein
MSSALPQYNGWANKPTWLVHLWLTSFVSDWHAVTQVVEKAHDKEVALQEYVEQTYFYSWLGELLDNPCLSTDLIHWVLAIIDWRALVAAFTVRAEQEGTR